MKVFYIVLLFFTGVSWGQEEQFLTAKLDSTFKKYGYVDSSGQFIISPKYDIAFDFISEYAAVKLDSLWGIIDQKGEFVIKPQFSSQISTVYRNHFMVYGTENMIFRDIEGTIKFDYLFIPVPFKEIHTKLDSMDLSKLENRDLMMRAIEISPTLCHYYQINRLYNSIAMGNEEATKMSISYVLVHPEEVKSAIEKDIAFEKSYANGTIGCCSHGSFLWD